MAHYFDVISCGIRQMHAQFSLLFELHTTPLHKGGLGLGLGCAAGTLEPLAYTRAHSSEFCYPILD